MRYIKTNNYYKKYEIYIIYNKRNPKLYTNNFLQYIIINYFLNYSSDYQIVNYYSHYYSFDSKVVKFGVNFAQ